MRRTGQLDQALHHLSKSIENSPGYLEAYLELGRAYQDQRAYPQALKIYQKAITIAPNDYRPYYLAGQAMKEGKDFPNAEAMLKKAAQLAPDEVGVHRLLGAVVVLNLVHSRRIASDEMKRP
jgi:tetratricopeptide (TPR) repeat protein